MKTTAALVIAAAAALQPAAPRRAVHTRRHGFFEDLFGSDDPAKNAARDEQWRIQQDVLKRRQSKEATNKYFDAVDANRQKAKQEQVTKWAFQRDPTQDSLIGWKKLRESGEIGNLKTGLGTDGKKREGGLPIPLPSFGLGGEAGVGGEYDNGERFDLRLPYVDQGYVLTRRPSFGAARTRRRGGGGGRLSHAVHLAQEDPDADVMGKFMDLFKKKPKDSEE